MISEEEIIRQVVERFNCFGGGTASIGNPIAAALKDDPPVFALGVDVGDVVRFVISMVQP